MRSRAAQAPTRHHPQQPPRRQLQGRHRNPPSNTAEGIVPEPSVERLAQVGKWMKGNGESSYGTQATPFGRELGEPVTGRSGYGSEVKVSSANAWRCKKGTFTLDQVDVNLKKPTCSPIRPTNRCHPPIRTTAFRSPCRKTTGRDRQRAGSRNLRRLRNSERLNPCQKSLPKPPAACATVRLSGVHALPESKLKLELRTIALSQCQLKHGPAASLQ